MRICAEISVFAIDDGTVQVGLRTTLVISAVSVGEGFSVLPTIDAIAPDDDVVLDGLGKGRGDVDHDIALAEGEIRVLEALERGLQLADALVHRDVQRRERPRRHRAGRRKAVARLEALQRLDDGLVKAPLVLVGGEVAADDQAACAGDRHAPGDAEREFGVRRESPAIRRAPR